MDSLSNDAGESVVSRNTPFEVEWSSSRKSNDLKDGLSTPPQVEWSAQEFIDWTPPNEGDTPQEIINWTPPNDSNTPRRSGRARVSKLSYLGRPKRRPSDTPSKKRPSNNNTSLSMEGVISTRKLLHERISATTKLRQQQFLHQHREIIERLLPANNWFTKNEEQQVELIHKSITQPEGVQGQMKPHQIEGLDYLVKMYQSGMPAILGDEMGLGKTLQTLSLFQWLTENEPVEGSRPFLVVCPLSVLSSWMREAKRWVPGLQVISLHGPQRKSLMKSLLGSACCICITTYDTFEAERHWFSQAFVWRYAVLDEGHVIKNATTRKAKALQLVNAEYRLLLTGTPLQNNLEEMWALLHWLLPDVFPANTADAFKDAFDLSAGRASTSFMDDARALLEILMLRRTKISPGIDLKLPPKEEIVLFVPLTAEQRQWYITLLTRIDQSTFDNVFRGATEKEQGEQHHKSQWEVLMNLLMQLRKVCTHPYLLDGVSPHPYQVDDGLRQSSSKFIVLDKLVEEVVMKHGKRLIIFSGFTKTLDLCEDLLSLRGCNNHDKIDRPFKYVRLDGSTEKAARNLAMRFFNNVESEYKVILLSTGAGGLGITLTAASDVVFMDEDWNPQKTLQAEARAHRIGQTQKVTIYKLCTQGTVEEQMLGRIRKKLYLSLKITEGMRNIHVSPSTPTKRKHHDNDDDTDNLQLDTSELMTLLRKGSRTMITAKINAEEISSWDWQTVLEKCTASTDSTDVMDEQQWLEQVERVETAVFEGRKHVQSPDKKVKLEEELTRADRRVGKNVTVMIDGFAVNKESMMCQDGEAVPTMAGKDSRSSTSGKEKRPVIQSQKHCQYCWQGGELAACTGCPRAYHVGCLEPSFQRRAGGFMFYCSQHSCHECGAKTAEAGGLLYRCRWCPRAFCEDCLEWDTVKLIDSTLPEYELLHHKSTKAWYVECAVCVNGWQTNHAAELSCRLQELKYEDAYMLSRSQHDQVDLQLTFNHTPTTVSEAATPDDALSLASNGKQH